MKNIYAPLNLIRKHVLNMYFLHEYDIMRKFYFYKAWENVLWPEFIYQAFEKKNTHKKKCGSS